MSVASLVLLVSPFIIFDLRYKMPDNFAGKMLYPTSAQAYMRPEAAQALVNAAQELYTTYGYKLVVWDAYRPHSVQKKMWEICPDERCVANPAKGSNHNRGLAIDCTLADKDGKLCKMPTAFDDFTAAAHRGDYKQCSDAVKKRMQIFERVMYKHGFTGLSTEWWHYDFPSADRTIYDISFDELP
jgi:D-alanyl-D-alanine dipeptidase